MSHASASTRAGLNIRIFLIACPCLVQVAGFDLLPLPPLSLGLPAALPFGEFEVLYYDGGLRIIRTGQGYMGVNQRIEKSGELV
jgi:hypothetical protein